MTRAERPSQECVATRRRAVLVVEDEILVRLTIADYLRGGYAVFEAANAAEAVAVFASGKEVDIVFYRRGDARRNGWAHARALGQEYCSGTRVTVTSGKGDADISSRLIPDDAFNSKPYSFEAVATRVRSLLEE
jgi:CheY-like chemotaxis protein